jgi:hypothetical protein
MNALDAEEVSLVLLFAGEGARNVGNARCVKAGGSDEFQSLASDGRIATSPSAVGAFSRVQSRFPYPSRVQAQIDSRAHPLSTSRAAVCSWQHRAYFFAPLLREWLPHLLASARSMSKGMTVASRSSKLGRLLTACMTPMQCGDRVLTGACASADTLDPTSASASACFDHVCARVDRRTSNHGYLDELGLASSALPEAWT